MSKTGVEVELVGQDGNALSIIGRVVSGMKRAGVEKSVINEFTEDAMSGDYNHLLRVCHDYVDVL